MDIKVLEQTCCGSGKMAVAVAEALDELGIDTEFQVVGDMVEILKYGVMKAPGLVINGKVKAMGRVPSKEELKKIIQSEK